MNFDNLSFILKCCAAALRKYAEYLKSCNCGIDVSYLATWYEHIESFGFDFDSMTLDDLKHTLDGCYWHLREFADLLKVDDDPSWIHYELLCRVLGGSDGAGVLLC